MVWLTAAVLAAGVGGGPVLPIVEAQERVYTPQPANNGAGPLWCYGSTCLVRVGDQVYLSGLETLADQVPLHNVRWVLYRRSDQGWERLQSDPSERQREPCPLGLTGDGALYLSSNPTLTPPGSYSGPAQPTILRFDLAQPGSAPTAELPVFSEPAPFTEHSYRGFAADGENGELLLFNILGYDRYYWSFRDRAGEWSAQGRLDFPIGTEYETPVPIRLCYPEIQVRDQAAHVLAISDITEPVTAWREFKAELTGQKWDYDFRRLFYTWTPDITAEPFRPWVEVASREQTAGHITNLDLSLDAEGRAHLLWLDQSVWNAKLRDRFFPEVKQTYTLRYGIVEDGRVITDTALLEGGEGIAGPVPGYARLQTTPDGRRFAFYYVSGRTAKGEPVNENRLVELLPDGTAGEAVRVPFERPFTHFMTATERGGSKPSSRLDLYGQVSGAGGLWYGQVDLGHRVRAMIGETIERTEQGTRLVLDGAASQSLDGALTSWTWEVAGRTLGGEQVTVEFDGGATVPVTLTVRDGAGQEHRARRLIHLPPAPAELGLERWGLVLRTAAESFAAQGGGAVDLLSDGNAGQTVGGLGTAGQWLEWEIDSPREADYRLLLRYAAPRETVLALAVDGDAPRTIHLPGTAGESGDRWAIGPARDAAGEPVTIALSAGRQTLRLENLAEVNLSLDYLDWTAVTAPFEPREGWEERSDGKYRYLIPLEGVLATRRIRAELGHCYLSNLGADYPGDGLPKRPASTLRLFEDGQELGPAHAVHADIRETGAGRFSHWLHGLYFSASDNSDPRTNGRRYTWRVEP